MGTMSRYQGHYQGRRHPPHAGAVLAVRTLSEEGDKQLLKDVLTVIHSREKFNRATRRFAFRLWVRHADSVRATIVGALDKFKGISLSQDSIPNVQRRLLTLARKM